MWSTPEITMYMVPTMDSNGKITDLNGKQTVRSRNNFDDDNAHPIIFPVCAIIRELHLITYDYGI